MRTTAADKFESCGSGCQAAYFAASVLGPLIRPRDQTYTRDGAVIVPTHGSVCHGPGGNGNQGEARALKNTPAELTRLSRNKPDVTAFRAANRIEWALAASARRDRQNLTKFLRVPDGATTSPNKRRL